MKSRKTIAMNPVTVPAVSIEPFESRCLFSVFAQDFSYDPPGPFDVPSNLFITSVSKGRLLVAGTIHTNGTGTDDPGFDTPYLSRLLPDGSLDRTFGKKGQIVFRPDQTILFTGSRILTTLETDVSHDLESIVAYTFNGKPDESFGGGDGKAQIEVLAPDTSQWIDSDVKIVHAYDDGSILTLHDVFIVGGKSGGHNQYQIVKTAPDGSLDNSFGNQGRLIVGKTFADNTAFVSRSGIYVYASYGFLTDPPSGALARYTADGKAPDKTFGNNGTLTLSPFIPEFAEQADGKLLYLEVPRTQGDTVLHRLNGDGTDDASFGADGKITLIAPPSSSLSGSGDQILLDSQNRITVTANDTIYRFSSTGQLDSYPFNGTAPFDGGDISFDDQGRILVGKTFSQRWAIVPNAQLDSAGVVHLVGTNDDDVMTVTSIAGGKLRFTINGEFSDFALSDIKRIDAQLYAGDNSLTVSVDLPVQVHSGDGNDWITTAGGDDGIFGNGGSDTISVGDGNDTIGFGSPAKFGTTLITGGNDDKNVTVNSGSMTISFGDGNNTILIGAITKDAHVTVGNGDNKINLNGGNDTVVAGNGDNNIDAATDNHADVTTGDGADTIGVFRSNILVHSNGGNDHITLGSQDASKGPTIFAGAGDDLLDAASFFSSPATIYGGDGNDSISTGLLSQTIYGEGGKDTIDAGAGDDYLSGGGASDKLAGDAGNDLIYAGPGDDRLDGGDGNDSLSGQDGRDLLFGGAGNDRVSGGASADSLHADAGIDKLYGDGGDDRLYADDATGRATLFGGAGDDTFITRDGRIDVLYGDGGRDRAEADKSDVLTSIEGA